MKFFTLLAFCSLGAGFAGAGTSQMVISEINFSPRDEDDGQWIELANLGTEEVELNGWSLYLATDTPGRVGTYWYGLPNGIELQPAELIRVHWLRPIPAQPDGDVYTGTSIFNFLFGYFAEPLPASGGALALLSSRENELMNDPIIIEDWVTWGGTGYKREDLATVRILDENQAVVREARWTAGASVPAPILGDSIALDLARNQDPPLISAYFHDASPTPGAANAAGSSVSRFGIPCGAGSPILQVESVPVPGNRDFRVRLDNTLGLPGELAALVLSQQGSDGSIMLLGCPIFVDVTVLYGTLGTATSVGQTFFNLSFAALSPALAGIEVNLQAAVANTQTGTILTTDAIRLILGN